MTQQNDLGPVRERNLHGLRNFFGGDEPEVAEARVDRCKIKLRGLVETQSDSCFQEYWRHVFPTQQIRPNLPSGPWGRPGSRRIIEILSGWTVGGSVSFQEPRQGTSACNLTLIINPTRTLAHALHRAGSYDGLESLDVFEFFLRNNDVVETARDTTLNQGDNALLSIASLGSQSAAARTSLWERFIRLYEQRLKELLLSTLAPESFGFDIDRFRSEAVAPRRRTSFSLNWPRLSVSEAEIYIERYAPEATTLVNSISERVLSAAREAHVDFYAGTPRLTRQQHSCALTLPLTKDINLKSYAKLANRVRLEVKYLKNLTSAVSRPHGEAEPFAVWVSHPMPRCRGAPPAALGRHPAAFARRRRR